MPSTPPAPRRVLKTRTVRAREVHRLPVVDVDDYERPRTRGDCLPGGCNEARPCQFVACRFNLFLDAHPRTGSIKLNFGELEPGDMVESCALDVADRGAHTGEEIGSYLSVTREAVRQIQERAMARIAELAPELAEALEYIDALPGEDEETTYSVRRERR